MALGVVAKLIIYGIFNLMNVIVFIILFVREGQWKLVFYMTLLSFWSNCFYFMSTYIMDLRAYFLKRKSEKFLPFMRNHYFKYSTTFSAVVMMGYYTLALLGPAFLSLQTSFFGWVLAIYLHGGEFCYVVFDFFVMGHSYIPTFWKDILIISIIYFGYFILSVFALYLGEIFAYKFMEYSNTIQLIVAFLLIYLILVNSYFLYQYILRKKMGIVIEEPTVLAENDQEALIVHNNKSTSITLTQLVVDKGLAQ